MAKRIKLFCIPYAGGSAAVFLKWRNLLDKSIELIPIELPGRGRRSKEPLITDFEELIIDLRQIVREKIKVGDKCVFFGHSMGTILALQLGYMVRDTIDSNCIEHIFFSGRYPPHIKKDTILKSQLPYDEFKREIMKYNATPSTIFENKELSDFYIPILRSDYSIVETYQHVDRGKNTVFNCKVTVLSGDKDEEVNSNDLNEWNMYTNNLMDLHIFEGGHFFINEHTNRIIEIINSSLV